MRSRLAQPLTDLTPAHVRAMRNSRFARERCRYPAGIGIQLLLLYLSMQARAQVSPGPLARAHQNLSGPANCTKCHAVSVRSPEFRCLDCHREIAAEIEQHRGLHATYSASGPIGASCVKCHSDHNGADFQLIHWQPTSTGFDHTKTGYTLDGKHATASCRSCHNAQHIAPEFRSLLADKDLNHTWMGLSTRCGTCHEDKHQGRFGSDCARCHSTTDWKQTHFDTTRFDHAKTPFPLTGKHRDTACDKCHTPHASRQVRWSGIAFAHCSDCHTDPHQGQFKQGCDFCHSTSTWQHSRFETMFDHAKTAYPLLGKHLTVACVDCHRGGDFKAPIPHAVCADCHKPDPHNGQFAHRADGGRCESCHTVQGWSPSTFTIAEHTKTGFPLTAPHVRVPCASCHIPAGQRTLFRINFALCIDCHKDHHGGQFAAAPWRNHCEKCHTGLTFRSSTMTLTLHQETRFPLTGSHIAVSCDDCHKPLRGSTVALFHFQQLQCTTCHGDIHHGQFTACMQAVDASSKPAGCEACHSTTQWNDLARFDHTTTRFALLGSHRAVACIDCHRPPAMELTLLHVTFSAAPRNCIACHENPHAGQFGEKKDNCGSCHNSEKWRPSLFDHEKTVFSLQGGHQNVACSACHVNKRVVDGMLVLFYKPTPTACEACHGGSIPPAKISSSAAPSRPVGDSGRAS
jgi:hypothetical protein